MYRTGEWREELGVRSGPYTGGAVLVRWDRIPLAVRAKLRDARPITAERASVRPWILFAIACASGFALVLTSGTGFGQLGDPLIVSPPRIAVFYALFLAGIVVPTWLLVHRMFSRVRWLSHRRFVLPLDAVEARDEGLVVRPFGDARDVVFAESSMRIQYADGSTFDIEVPRNATNVKRAMHDAQDALVRATTPAVESDPFAPLRDAHGFVRPERLRRGSVSTRARRALSVPILLAVACAAVALPIVRLRDLMSDDAAFMVAWRSNGAADYEAYLAHALVHRDAVRETFLPRAKLDQAERRHDVWALEQYLREHPHSRFDFEARNALDATYASDVDSIVTFDELDGYLDAHPDARPLRRRGVEHVAASARGRITAQVENAAVRAVLLGVVDEAERTGSAVPVRAVVYGVNQVDAYDAQSSLLELVGVTTPSTDASDLTFWINGSPTTVGAQLARRSTLLAFWRVERDERKLGSVFTDALLRSAGTAVESKYVPPMPTY